MSLTREDLNDIKQLMEATVGAAIKDQNEIFEKRFDDLEKRMDERFDEVDNRFDEILDAVGAQFNEQEERLDNHEKRIVRLEQRVA